MAERAWLIERTGYKKQDYKVPSPSKKVIKNLNFPY